jgi:UDP-N-acetylmuramate dehydrogenase
LILETELTLPAERVETPLADLTTLRVGGPARRLLTVGTEEELIACVRDLDADGQQVLVLGGGSNLLVADEGFPGTVVKIESRGVRPDVSACAGASVRVAAGEIWDDLVVRAIDEKWIGLEAMSGIPGLVGATPIQNVGAYGAEVASSIENVRTYDRLTGQVKTFAPSDCGFSYRSSRFKTEPGRYVVLSVTFQLLLGTLSAPVSYAELARTLGVPLGARVPASEVREAVLELRRSKGMVLDGSDHDTWSAGSFFTNPILDPVAAGGLPEAAPRYPQPGGAIKTSAAWLIEQAGFAKGYGEGPARLSTKHTLALTNRGTAAAEDILRLARQVREGVRACFGITLVPEPVLVGCEL